MAVTWRKLAFSSDVINNSLLTTRGDVIRRGATAPERLALGTSGQALVSDGTDLVWGSGSAGQLLGTAVAKGISWNAQTIAENITVGATQNGFSVGPISVSGGYSVTITSGGKWYIA